MIARKEALKMRQQTSSSTTTTERQMNEQIKTPQQPSNAVKVSEAIAGEEDYTTTKKSDIDAEAEMAEIEALEAIEDIADDDDTGADVSASIHVTKPKLVITLSATHAEGQGFNSTELKEQLNAVNYGDKHFSLHNPLRRKGNGDEGSPLPFLKKPIENIMATIAGLIASDGLQVLATDATATELVEGLLASLDEEANLQLVVANSDSYDLAFDSSSLRESYNTAQILDTAVEDMAYMGELLDITDTEADKEELLEAIDDINNIVVDSEDFQPVHNIPLGLEYDPDTGYSVEVFKPLSDLYRISTWRETVEVSPLLTEHTLVVHLCLQVPAFYTTTKEGEKLRILDIYGKILKAYRKSLDIDSEQLPIVFGVNVTNNALLGQDTTMLDAVTDLIALSNSEDSDYVSYSVSNKSPKALAMLNIDTEIEPLMFPFSEDNDTGLLFIRTL